jgi:two-component system LytT family response regulator
MLNVIIIDDDRNGREFLQAMLQEYFSGRITVLATCSSVSEGIVAIHKTEPDLVFLDIEMPQASGFELIEKLGTIKFDVVFVTAYSKYALKAIKFHALDYLLKPVSPEELTKTIEWAEKRLSGHRPSYNGNELLEKFRSAFGQQSLGVPTKEGVIFLPIASIIRCEASSNYTVIYSESDKKIMVSRTLKDLEDALLAHDFIRVHKSHLINVKRIAQYYRKEGTIQLQDGSNIPLGRNCKEEFEKRMLMI